uniref:Uncharacterized protein n=1 Tax=Salix viminalis TaxID=40686 RepID=A0A6N2L749_SALVM
MSIELLNLLNQIDAYTIWQVQVNDFFQWLKLVTVCLFIDQLIGNESYQKRNLSEFSLIYYVKLLELTSGSLLKCLKLLENKTI